MIYLWAALLMLLNTLWLGLVVLGLPGNWLMVVSTALVAWWQWEHASEGTSAMFSLTPLVVIVVLAFVGEGFELLAGVFGSKRAGGTRRGSIGALVGGLLGGVGGTIFIPAPVLGSLIGACGGAGLGAWGFELTGGRTMGDSLRSGAGAGAGKLAGTLSKLAVGAAIWLIIAVAAFWP
jgi:hypothetical protein